MSNTITFASPLTQWTSQGPGVVGPQEQTHSPAGPLSIGNATGQSGGPGLDRLIPELIGTAVTLAKTMMGDGSQASAELDSFVGKLTMGVAAFTAGRGAEDATAAIVSEQIKDGQVDAAQRRSEIADTLNKKIENNRKRLQKLEERASELEKADGKSGCEKVVNVVVDVVKIAVSAVQGNYAAAVANLGAMVCKLAGQEEAGQLLGSLASALGTPKTADVAGAVAKETESKVDEVKRANHDANANDLMADVRQLGASAMLLDAEKDADLQELQAIVAFQDVAIGVFEEALTREDQTIANTQQQLGETMQAA